MAKSICIHFLLLVFSINVIAQPYFKIENTKKNAFFFNEKIPGSLFNILKNNESHLSDFMYNGNKGLDLFTLEDFSLDTTEFLKFEFKRPIEIELNDGENYILFKTGTSYENWIDSLLNDPEIDRDDAGNSVYEILRYYHQTDSIGLKKKWLKALEGEFLFNHLYVYASIKKIDYLMYEPIEMDNGDDGTFYFMRETPKGPLCTFSCSFDQLKDFIYNDEGFELTQDFSTKVTSEFLTMAKEMALDANKKEYDDFTDIRPYHFDNPHFLGKALKELPIFNSNDSNGILWKTQVDGDFVRAYSHYSGEQLYIEKTTQTFKNWFDSLVDPTPESNIYIDEYGLSEYIDLMGLYEYDSSSLIRAWDKARPGEQLQFDPKSKPVWVNTQKPKLHVFGKFSTIKSLPKNIARVDTIIIDDEPYTLYFNKHNHHITGMGTNKLSHLTFDITKVLVSECSNNNEGYVMEFNVKDYKTYLGVGNLDKTLTSSLKINNKKYIKGWTKLQRKFEHPNFPIISPEQFELIEPF